MATTLATLLLICLCFIASGSSTRPVSIGVIGGGVGGTAFANFFLKLAPSPKHATVTIYEKADRLGGRVRSLRVPASESGLQNDMVLEVGASIAYAGNRYISSFVEGASLKLHNRVPREDNPEGSFGIFDGGSFVFKQVPSSYCKSSSNFPEFACKMWYNVSNKVRLALRYNLNLRGLFSFVTKAADAFNDIYALQLRNESFATASELWSVLDLGRFTGGSFEDLMLSEVLHKCRFEEGILLL
jgi:hypothetical protein